MTTRRSAVVGMVAVALLIGCTRSLPTYRYRMTVEVDTPQGLRRGSSVIEIRTSQGTGIPNNNRATYIRGEGVALSLPGKQVLFALLCGERPDAADAYAIDAYEGILTKNVGPLGANIGLADWLRELKRQRAPAVLPRFVMRLSNPRWPTYPLLVRFRDLRDPKTVEEVDPENLATSFGPGFKLRRIVIQITDDPISSTMKDRLPWLPNYYNRMLDGATNNSSSRMNNRLASGCFSTEAHN